MVSNDDWFVILRADTKPAVRSMKRMRRKLWRFDHRNLIGWAILFVMLVCAFLGIGLVLWSLGKLIMVTLGVFALLVLVGVLTIGPSVGAND